jgi:hypothetical protein
MSLVSSFICGWCCIRNHSAVTRPPLWSSGQSFWLQIQRSVLGSIPGASRFSEKQRVWNGVHSASWGQLRSYLEEIIAAPVRKIETNDRGDPLRCPSKTLYPQKLALLRQQAAVARSAQFASGPKPRSFFFCRNGWHLMQLVTRSDRFLFGSCVVWISIRHWASWVKVFVVFFSSSRQVPGSPPLRSKSFPVLHLVITNHPTRYMVCISGEDILGVRKIKINKYIISW